MQTFVPPPPPGAAVPPPPPPPSAVVPPAPAQAKGGVLMDMSDVFAPSTGKPKSLPPWERKKAKSPPVMPTVAKPATVTTSSMLNRSLQSLDSAMLQTQGVPLPASPSPLAARPGVGSPATAAPVGTSPQPGSVAGAALPPPSSAQGPVAGAAPVAPAPPLPTASVPPPPVQATVPPPPAAQAPAPPVAGAPSSPVVAVPAAAGQPSSVLVAPASSSSPASGIPTSTLRPTVHTVIAPSAVYYRNEVHRSVVDPAPPPPPAPRPAVLRKKGHMPPPPGSAQQRKPAATRTCGGSTGIEKDSPLGSSAWRNRYDLQPSPSTQHLPHAHPLAQCAATSSTRRRGLEKKGQTVGEEAWRGVHWKHVDVHRYIARQYFGGPPPVEK